MRLELATSSLSTCALATELTRSKAIARKELSLSASLYIYHFSTVVDFSSEK